MFRKRISLSVGSIVALGGCALVVGMAIGGIVFRAQPFSSAAPPVEPGAAMGGRYPWSEPESFRGRSRAPGSTQPSKEGARESAAEAQTPADGLSRSQDSVGTGTDHQEKTGAAGPGSGAEAAAPPGPGDRVYITPSGKRFHASRDCPALRRSKRVSEVTVEEARGKGLTPCSMCY